MAPRLPSSAIWVRGRMRSSSARGGGKHAPAWSYQSVLMYLDYWGPTRAERLADRLGLPDRRAHRILLTLWEYGFTTTHLTPGRWRLTAGGQALVAALRLESGLARV